MTGERRRLTILGTVVLAACDLWGPGTPAVLEADRILGHIQALAADSLRGRGAASDQERQAAEYVADRFEAIGLVAGVPGYLQTFHIDGDPQRGSQNVLGIIPGRGTLAHEWVIVGAHYDAVGWEDTDPPARPDCWGGSWALPCNGADDNASGTALMLDLARVLADDAERDDAPDRRAVMFHAYGSEEVGLVGSFYFCQNPTIVLEDVQAMVNLDMVGRLREGVLTALAVASSSAWPAILNGANTEGLALQFDNQIRANSDHFCFTVAGIPAVFLFTGLHEQYHTPYDDVGLINAPGAVQVGNLALRVLRDLIERPDRLPVLQARTVLPGDGR